MKDRREKIQMAGRIFDRFVARLVGRAVDVPAAEVPGHAGEVPERRGESRDGITRFGYAQIVSDVTRILSAIDARDPSAAAQLLPLVCDELRKLAAGHMANEASGHTLDATALVHEVYLRLVGPATDCNFANRAHFFAAAADAMRRILVDHARKKACAQTRRRAWSGPARPRPSAGPRR